MRIEAVATRPRTIGALAAGLVLLAVVVRPVREPATISNPTPWPCVVAGLGDLPVTAFRLDIDRQPTAAMPNAFRAGQHPDMRPWPHGMVIAPAPIDQDMVIGRSGPIADLVSGLVGALRSLGA